jgi:hypothetical protein
MNIPPMINRQCNACFRQTDAMRIHDGLFFWTLLPTYGKSDFLDEKKYRNGRGIRTTGA